VIDYLLDDLIVSFFECLNVWPFRDFRQSVCWIVCLNICLKCLKCLNVWIRIGGRGGADAAVRTGNRRGTTFEYLNLLNVFMWMFKCIYTHPMYIPSPYPLSFGFTTYDHMRVVFFLFCMTVVFLYCPLPLNAHTVKRLNLNSQPPDLLYLNVWFFLSFPSALLFTLSFCCWTHLIWLFKCFECLNFYTAPPPPLPAPWPPIRLPPQPSPQTRYSNSNVWMNWVILKWIDMRSEMDKIMSGIAWKKDYARNNRDSNQSPGTVKNVFNLYDCD
jgi:hypothetical protein